MTGRQLLRTGLTRPLLTGENPAVNPWEGEATPAALLSQEGCRTALSGKRHLGKTDGSWPRQAGDDVQLGIPSMTFEMSQALDLRLSPDLLNKPERVEALRGLVQPQVTAGTRGGPPTVIRDPENLGNVGSIDQTFADHSDAFIRETVDKGQPFFLVRSFARLHNDNHPAPAMPAKALPVFRTRMVSSGWTTSLAA